MKKVLKIAVLAILLFGVGLIYNENTADAATNIDLISHDINRYSYEFSIVGDPGTKFEMYIAKKNYYDSGWTTRKSLTDTLPSNGIYRATLIDAFNGPGEYLITVHDRTGTYSYDSKRIIKNN